LCLGALINQQNELLEKNMTTKAMMEALLAGKTLVFGETDEEVVLNAEGNIDMRAGNSHFYSVELPSPDARWHIKPKKQVVWVRYHSALHEFYPFVFHTEEDATASGTYKAYPVEIEVE